MKKSTNLVWGIALILISAALLADRMGIVDFAKISENAWVYIFAGAAVLFLLIYFLNGIKHWGWLFPVFIGAALSLTIWMTTHHLDGAFLGAPILGAIALPFFVGFSFDRKNWGLLIPAWILTILTAITLLVDRVEGTWIGGLFLLSTALPFLIVFLSNNTRRWALIPAWILFILGMITLLSEHVNGNLIGAVFLYSVALPFLVVFLMDRTRRWALIPAAVVAILGTFPLVSMLISGDVMGAVGMFLFALPFYVVFFHWKESWWALIPAGIFTSIGLVVVISMFVPKKKDQWSGILTGILFLGMGLTFGYIWLRRVTYPTTWAMYLAIGLLAASLLSFILGRNFQDYWAIILMIVGIVMVVISVLPKKPGEPSGPSGLS